VISGVTANQQVGDAVLSIDIPVRRLGVRERWEQLRYSETLNDLLEELALWTAPWTGFVPRARSVRRQE
jgi:hypothetical protein